MKSQEYKDLMNKLHNLKKKVVRIDMTLGQKESATLTFDDSSVVKFAEDDVIDYLIKLKRGIDNDGDYVFREINDLEKYFNDEKYLAHEHDQKVADASHDLASGKFKFAYDVDQLQKEFLLSKTRNDVKYEPLRTDYFQIASYRIMESASLLKLHQKHQKDSQDYEKYFLAICKILATAFRKDKNFIKNFAKKDKKAKLDLLNALNKYSSVLQHSKDMQPLFTPHGVNKDTGIRLVLESYRKYAEACVDPLNFVRIAYELNNGEVQPADRKKAQENKAILAAELSTYLGCLDPHIRNSEAHVDTQFDHASQRLKISDQDGYVAEYSYAEMIKMTNDLMHNLLPALMVAISMESQLVMLILSHRSTEYITALLGIGNS